jgi:WD40 repeat protein
VAYWNRLCHGELRSLKLAPAFTAPAFSGDSARLAAFVDRAVGAGTLKVWETGTGRECFKVEFSDWQPASTTAALVDMIQLSRDGTRVAAVRLTKANAHVLQVWEVLTGKELLRLEFEDSLLPPDCLTLSPEGDRVACIFSSTGKDPEILTFSTKSVKTWLVHGGQEGVAMDFPGGYVGAVAFSADGKLLAGSHRPDFNAQDGGNLVLCDAATGKRRAAWKCSGIFGNLAFSPDTAHVAVTVVDIAKVSAGKIQLVEVATGKEVFGLPLMSLPGGPWAFSADGQRLAGFESFYERNSGAKDVTICEIATGQKILTLKGHRAGVLAVAFGGGGHVWTATSDGAIHQWDATAKEPFHAELPKNSMWLAAANASGTRFLCVPVVLGMMGIDQESQALPIRVFDSAGKELRAFTKHRHPVKSVLLHPDGIHAYSLSVAGIKDAGKAGELLAWNTDTGAVDLVVPMPFLRQTDISSTTCLAALSPDGKLLGVAFFEGFGVLRNTFQVRSAVTGQELFTLPGKEVAYLAPTFSPDSKWLLFARSTGSLAVLDARTGNEQRSWKVEGSRVREVSFDRDGKRVAVAWHRIGENASASSYQVRTYDLQTGAEAQPVKAHEAQSHWATMALSPDGKLLALAENSVGRPSGPPRVALVDATSGEVRHTLRGHLNFVSMFAFTPDSRRLAVRVIKSNGSVETNEIRLWDVASGQELLSLTAPSGGRLQFSADGNRLLALGAYSPKSPPPVTVWDARPWP